MNGGLGKINRNNRGSVSPLVNKQPRINSTPRKVSLFDKLKTDDKFKKHLKGLLEVESDITHKQLKGYKKNELLDMLLLQCIIKDHTNELNNLIRDMKALKLELDLYKYEYRNNTNLASKVDVTAERLTHSGLTPNVNIYDRLKNHLKNIDDKIKVANTMIETEIKREYNNSKKLLGNNKIRKDKLSELTNKLNTLQTQQLYLDDKLTLTSLAEALELKPHMISQVINQTMQTSFYKLINSYRVEYAITLIEQKGTSWSIERIAFESGFGNRVTFNNAFKTLKGCSPSVFKKNLKLAG